MAPTQGFNLSRRTVEKGRAARKAISFEVKLWILDRLQDGERPAHIARELSLPESTIRTIRRNEEKIRMCSLNGTCLSVRSQCRIRDSRMEIMERSLMAWMQEMETKPSDVEIRKKAFEMFNYLKDVTNQSGTVQFIASKGWLMRFKKRYSLDVKR